MYSFYIYSDAERLSRSFTRIGVYDFTKSLNNSNNTEAKKIESLKVKSASDYCDSKIM